MWQCSGDIKAGIKQFSPKLTKKFGITQILVCSLYGEVAVGGELCGANGKLIDPVTTYIQGVNQIARNCKKQMWSWGEVNGIIFLISPLLLQLKTRT